MHCPPSLSHTWNLGGLSSIVSGQSAAVTEISIELAYIVLKATWTALETELVFMPVMRTGPEKQPQLFSKL